MNQKIDRSEGPYSPEQAGKFCRVSHRTVCHWCDKGLLPMWLVPGSKHRRINKTDLLKFMIDHHIPTDLLIPAPETPKDPTLCHSHASLPNADGSTIAEGSALPVTPN